MQLPLISGCELIQGNQFAGHMLFSSRAHHKCIKPSACSVLLTTSTQQTPKTEVIKTVMGQATNILAVMQSNLLHWGWLILLVKSLPHFIGQKWYKMPSISQLPSWRTPKIKNINMEQVFTEGDFFRIIALPSGSRNVHSVDKQCNIRQGNSILS